MAALLSTRAHWAGSGNCGKWVSWTTQNGGFYRFLDISRPPRSLGLAQRMGAKTTHFEVPKWWFLHISDISGQNQGSGQGTRARNVRKSPKMGQKIVIFEPIFDQKVAFLAVLSKPFPWHYGSGIVPPPFGPFSEVNFLIFGPVSRVKSPHFDEKCQEMTSKRRHFVRFSAFSVRKPR